MTGVKVRVVDGFAVHDGKKHVTSGELTLDPEQAEQLEAFGVVEPVKASRHKRTVGPVKCNDGNDTAAARSRL
jgi:hypothetical protein